MDPKVKAPSIHLDAIAARRVMVAAQGLDRRAEARADKAAVLAVIRRLGMLQIDSIHVVARSPYLTVFSRLGAYDPHWLDELLAEGALFEYWAHAACFLPIEDFALFRHRMLHEQRDHGRHTQTWLETHTDEVDAVLAQLRTQGAVKAADFEGSDHRGGSWWQWKPEKRVLEALFNVGEVMIARRDRFQRVYDLRERVLPGWDDARALPAEQAQRLLVERTVRALGLVAAPWIADYYRLERGGLAADLEHLSATGALFLAEVEGWPTPTFIHADNVTLAQRAAEGALHPTLTTLLTPFDPLVWDRRRTKAVFDLDYSIECYTPAHKRRYGYFCLPLLRRGALVGRVDAKAYRQDGRFGVIALFLEPGVAVDDALAHDVAQALAECAAWHETPSVSVDRTEPTAFKEMLEAALAQVSATEASAC